MGRGRAKAKQTKVARELKYRPVGTDLNALRAELTGSNGSASGRPRAEPARPVDDPPVDELDELDDDDPYAIYADGDEDDEPATGRTAPPG